MGRKRLLTILTVQRTHVRQSSFNHWKLYMMNACNLISIAQSARSFSSCRKRCNNTGGMKKIVLHKTDYVYFERSY